MIWVAADPDVTPNQVSMSKMPRGRETLDRAIMNLLGARAVVTSFSLESDAAIDWPWSVLRGE